MALPIYIIAAVIFFIYGLNIFTRFKLRRFKGPSPVYPFLGNLVQLGQPTVNYKTHKAWHAKYGGVFAWHLGRHAFVNVDDPEVLKQIGVKNFMKFHNRSDPLLVPGGCMDTTFTYSGMLIAKGKYWASLRAACEPLFHSRMLQSYAPTISKACDKLVEILSKPAEQGTSVNINDAVAKLTMDVIGLTAFGVDFEAQNFSETEKPSELFSTAQTVFEPFDAAGVGRIVPVLCFCIPHLTKLWVQLAMWVGTDRVRKNSHARRFLWGVSQVLLDNSRQASGSNSGSVDKDSATEWIKSTPEYKRAYALFQGVVPATNSLLYKLRDAKPHGYDKPLTDLDICAQSFTFLLAGYETTSLALGYALYELAKDPVLQQRVREEVDTVMAAHNGGNGNGGEVTLDMLSEMKLLEAVFNESLRLWPPVTSIIALNREVGEDVEVCGHTLHKGTRIMFSVFSLHRNPQHYPEPEKFKPERFLPDSEEAKSRHPYAFIPFGLGPRKCIGMRLALEEGLVVLSKMLSTYSWSLDEERHKVGEELKLHSFITLMPLEGIWLKLKKRC